MAILVPYGVDASRLERLCSSPSFYEELIEDEARWFDLRDAKIAHLIARGLPSSRAAARQILDGEPLDASAWPVYLGVCELLCQYAGQQLDLSTTTAWDESLAEVFDRWLFSIDVPWRLSTELLIAGDCVLEIPRAPHGLGAGWLDAERCEALDEFFGELDECWREESLEDASDGVGEVEELFYLADTVEQWLSVCSMRGWGLATFYR